MFKNVANTSNVDEPVFKSTSSLKFKEFEIAET